MALTAGAIVVPALLMKEISMLSRMRIASCALAMVCALSASLPALAGPVNINTADAATLARELKGVGIKRAEAIVEYRKAHGPFRSADELALIKGIGPKAIEANRADIRVDGAASAGQKSPAAAPKGAPAASSPKPPAGAR
jgi:competence protein ComEA